jgi:hypothetical protein
MVFLEEEEEYEFLLPQGEIFFSVSEGIFYIWYKNSIETWTLQDNI